MSYQLGAERADAWHSLVRGISEAVSIAEQQRNRNLSLPSLTYKFNYAPVMCVICRTGGPTRAATLSYDILDSVEAL